jgi:putative redox protein
MDVKAKSLEGYQVEIQSGNHTWISDEPLGVGLGQDRGPSPYGLLLGALAACKLITVRMYADRKGWTLEDVEIKLKHEKIRVGDGDEFESPVGSLVDSIETEVSFKGDLTPEQVERLAEISNRCPVHRTLISETRIHSVQEIRENPGG